MAIYEAINAVAQQYARYHASRITSASRLCDTDPAYFTAEEQAAWREFTHWQDRYEQSKIEYERLIRSSGAPTQAAGELGMGSAEGAADIKSSADFRSVRPPKATLWGYISAGFYRQVQPLLDGLRKELLP